MYGMLGIVEPLSIGVQSVQKIAVSHFLACAQRIVMKVFSTAQIPSQKMIFEKCVREPQNILNI